MLTLLKLELEKLFRSRNFYLSFLVLIGFVALMLWGFYTYAAVKRVVRPTNSSAIPTSRNNTSTA